MWLLQLVLKAAIFFTLFAFALNNQHEAVVHFFFGTSLASPVGVGCVAGLRDGRGRGCGGHGAALVASTPCGAKGFARCARRNQLPRAW